MDAKTEWDKTMIPITTILSLLNSPIGHAAIGFAGKEIGRGAYDLHRSIEIDLYNRESQAILYRGQVLAYVHHINQTGKSVCPCSQCGRMRSQRH